MAILLISTYTYISAIIARFRLALMDAAFLACLFLFFLLLVPSSVAAAGLSKPVNNLGLVGYWSFNEGTSTKVTDYSGKGNLGTFPGGSANPTWTNGKLGAALSFDGGDYVGVGTALPLRITGAVTVSAWIKPSSVTVDQKIVANDNGTGGGYKFGIYTNSKVEFEIKTSGNSPTTNRAVGGGTVLQAGVWYHVVGVYSDSGDYIKTYVNGVLDRTNASATGVLAAPPSGSFAIGQGPGEGLYFNGLMDEIRVYNRILSDAEIAALYNSSGSAKFGSSKSLTAGTTLADGLVGHWTFDGADTPWTSATAAITLDKSGNSKNGTLTNMNRSSAPTVGKLGQALTFDGADDHVVLNGLNIGNNSDFTFCEWMKPSAWLGTNPGFWRSDVSSGGGYFNIFQGSTGRPWIRWNTVNILQPGSGYAVSLDVWTHVCYVIRSAADAQFYANGELQHSASHSTATTAFTIYNLGWQSSIDQRITGLHDDVRIYNRALSASEVKQLYNLGGAKLNTSSGSTQGSGLANGLVGHWTFDGADTQSTIADKSGNANNGYFYGGATSSAKTIGKLGQALKFDGVDDYVKISDANSLDITDKITVMVWMKPVVNITGYKRIIEKSYSTSWFFGNRNGAINNLEVWINGAARAFTAPTVYNTNEWSLVGFTYDKDAGGTDEIRLYVNGQQQGSGDYSTAIGTDNLAVEIGREQGGGAAGYTNALFDDVRIYNRALSASEVKQLYLMGK